MYNVVQTRKPLDRLFLFLNRHRRFSVKLVRQFQFSAKLVHSKASAEEQSTIKSAMDVVE